MTRIFLLVFIIFPYVIVATDNNDLKCTSSDFRTYVHCIKKRETTNWCSARGCTTCRGSLCQVSCKGFSCGNCPDGNCCNGRNCNACYNENCCTSPACNYCLNTCKQACIGSSSAQCLNTCSGQCPNTPQDVFLIPSKIQNNGQQDVTIYIKGIPHTGHATSGRIPNGNRTAIVTVDGTEYLASVLSLAPNSCQQGSCGTSCANKLSYGKCCNDANCNSCYESCSSNCHVDTCYENCSNKCSNQSIKKNESIIISNPTIVRFNVTTVINITNVINNTNEIDNPLFVNNTNLNNFTLPNLAPNESQRIIYYNHYQQLQRGCCHVVHPPQCFNNHIYPYRHCFRRSHQECSNLCTSQFIHLTPNFSPQPQVPLLQQQSQCHYIRSYPYVYCGQNSIQNCDSCYICNGQYNPNQCARQTGCSDACKQSFVLPNVPRLQQGQPNLPQQQQEQQQHGSYRLVYPGTPEYQQIMGYLQNHRARLQAAAPIQYG